MVSFGLVTGLGYFMLSFLQIYSKRIVHRLYISNDFETVHLEFFNAFWVLFGRSRNPKQLSSTFLSFRNLCLDSLTLRGSS